MTDDNKRVVLDAAAKLVSLTEAPIAPNAVNELATTIDAIASALRRAAAKAGPKPPRSKADEAARVGKWRAKKKTAIDSAPPLVNCWCYQCNYGPEGIHKSPFDRRMCLCPTCGNKRCPRATSHDNACTDSNEPGQPGSNY